MTLRLALRRSILSVAVALFVRLSLGTAAPADAAIAVSVDAGWRHTCALTTWGGVQCWGENDYGQLGDGTTTDRQTAVDVTGLTSGVAEISAGRWHTCALTTGGGVKCWGWNALGQLGDGTTTDHWTPVDVTGLTSGVAAISASARHTCALTSNGGVKCWGGNEDGQLGDGTTTWRLTAVDVAGLTSGVAALTTGSLWHTCALTTGGGVKCWGANNFGALGDGTTAPRATAVDVVGLTSGVAAIAAGASHTCALTTGGGIKCWGRNDSGQLGDGSTTQRLTAVNVTGLTSGVTSISLDDYFSCALSTSGGVKCWGSNGDGQLGDGTTMPRATAVDVAGLTSGVAAISAGASHSCALTTSGSVQCWGSNWSGQLGVGPRTFRSTPVDVTGLTSGVVATSAGGGHSCAITTAGGVKCWGFNGAGQLGDGTTTHRLTAVDVTSLTSGVAAVSAGGFQTCALTTSGGLKCWGGTPADVPGLTGGVAAISTGNEHNCAVTSGGGVKCWLFNDYGQLGDGTTAFQPTPVDVTGLTSGVLTVAAGATHTCALTTVGGVKCWGWNALGQLGDGTTTDRLTPVDVMGLTSGVAAITGGGFSTCALLASGGVKCWGSNGRGQLGDGTMTSRVTAVDVTGLTSGVAAIAAGYERTCALTTVGGVKCWGWNGYGQLGDGTTTDRPTPVSVTGLTSGVAAISNGDGHACALSTSGGVKCWGWNQWGQLGNGEWGYELSPATVAGFGGTCGNGAVEVGEQCDDGNTSNADCCSSICQFESSATICRTASGECDIAETCTGASGTCPVNEVIASGTSCTDDADACTIDACDDFGACAHTPLADGDGDAICDQQDACTNIGGARDFYAKPKLILSKINTDTVPGNDGLKLSAAFDLPSPTSFAALDPIQRGARILLLNQAGGVEVDQSLPGGAYTGSGTRGWKANTKGTVWQYLDKTASPLSGITSVKVTDKTKASAGRVSTSLTAKKATYPVVSGDQPLQLLVVLGNQTDAIAGFCGESNFTLADCRFNGAQNSLVCRQ